MCPIPALICGSRIENPSSRSLNLFQCFVSALPSFLVPSQTSSLSGSWLSPLLNTPPIHRIPTVKMPPSRWDEKANVDLMISMYVALRAAIDPDAQKAIVAEMAERGHNVTWDLLRYVPPFLATFIRKTLLEGKSVGK